MSFKAMLFILVCSFSFLQMDCKDDPPVVTPINPLKIAIGDVTCTEVFLTLSLAGTESNRTVTLKRGDSIIAIISMGETDSLFIDERLLPKQTYTYSLVKENWSASIQATTQDTTSHEVQWQLPDTLGAQGLIRDVWVFSRDNAWAVGEIYLSDSAGKPDYTNRYNLAKWDGIKWESKQIMFYTICGQENRTAYPASSIFAFGENDIWIAMYGDQVVRCNGTTQTVSMCMPVSFTISKLWGQNSNSVFAVGDKGSIVKFSNGTWSKMESNTTVDLQDIWGIDDSHVWATGTNTNDGHSVVLQYDGKQWTTIYDNANKPPNEFFGFRTLWTNRADNVFLAGGSKSQLMDLTKRSFRQLNILQQQWVAFNIRGINGNDIYQVGSAGEVVHFNGYSWYLYPELKNLISGIVGLNSVFPSTDFVLVGGLNLTELNGFPIVIRGYR